MTQHAKRVGAEENLFWSLRNKLTKEAKKSWEVDVIPPSIHDPSSPTSSGSPLRGRTIRSRMKKIQIGIPLNDHQNQSFHTLFTWAKEITKIWRITCNCNRI